MENLPVWNRKRRFKVLGVVLLAACMGFYFTPNLTIYNMKKASEAKDTDTFSSYVDYPSLRENLRANYNTQLARELAKGKRGSTFNTFAASLAATLINPMADGLTTPESLAMLMKGEIPETTEQEGKEKSQVTTKGINTETSTAYKGFNSFIMRVRKKDSAAVPVEFVFKRYGLISWKLSGLRIN